MGGPDYAAGWNLGWAGWAELLPEASLRLAYFETQRGQTQAGGQPELRETGRCTHAVRCAGFIHTLGGEWLGGLRDWAWLSLTSLRQDT